MENQTQRRRRRGNGNALSFDTIEAAVSGREDAIQQVIQHYDHYLTNLSTREIPDEDGEPQAVVDYDLKEKLTAKLMEAILRFELHKDWNAPKQV